MGLFYNICSTFAVIIIFTYPAMLFYYVTSVKAVKLRKLQKIKQIPTLKSRPKAIHIHVDTTLLHIDEQSIRGSRLQRHLWETDGTF